MMQANVLSNSVQKHAYRRALSQNAEAKPTGSAFVAPLVRQIGRPLPGLQKVAALLRQFDPAIASKDYEVVEYALNRSLSPALIAEYQTRLPDKQLLQAKLHEFYALNTAQGEAQ